jgi:hypothetical protein
MIFTRKKKQEMRLKKNIWWSWSYETLIINHIYNDVMATIIVVNYHEVITRMKFWRCCQSKNNEQHCQSSETMNWYEATTIMKLLRHSHQNKRNELLKLQHPMDGALMGIGSLSPPRTH